jgi:hypothetical protein
MHGEAVSTRPAPARGQVDRTALRTNQACIIVLLALALGTAAPQAALFQRAYRDLLRPAGLLRPDVHAEDPAPHRFAQGLGAAVLLAATLALFAGAAALGWGLAFVVIGLAAINLLFGFCAGCFVYFQLARLRG